MNGEKNVLSLTNIGKGSAVELFNVELCRVLENALDPNFKAEAARTINLKVTLIPTKERDMGTVKVEVKSTLPPRTNDGCYVTIGKQGGKAVAANVTPGINPGQNQLPGTRDGKVVNMENNQ